MQNKMARYIGIFIFIFILWDSKLLYPLKILTVFFHELGHAFASVLFGGGFREIHIDLKEGGYTLVAATGFFSRFVIISSGYIGSAMFGALLLILGMFEGLQDKLLVGIGILLTILSFCYSSIFSFTTLFAVGFLGFGFLMYKLCNGYLNQWTIEIIGVTNVTYAVIDIWDDTIRRRQAPSDAYHLYELTHIPTFIWGVVWIFITFSMIFYTFQIVHYIQRKKRSL